MEDEFVLDMVDHAVMYADSGFSVIPLQPRQKIPAINTWRGAQNEAPTPETIKRWWSQYPHCNIGLVCGAVSQCVVVDCDGLEAVKRYSERFPHLLDTYQVASGSRKGRHFYYRTRGGMKSTRYIGTVGNVEIQADGKYVVAAPSVHPTGGIYEGFGLLSHLIETDLAEVVEWISVLTAKKHGLNQRRNSPSASSKPIGDGSRYWDKAIAGEIDTIYKATQGNQNNALYRASLKIGSIVAAGQFDLDKAVSALWGAAIGCGYTGRDGDGATFRTIQSGLRQGMRSARNGKQSA